jgi:hypothetical protein
MFLNISINRLYCTIPENFNGLYVFDQYLTFIKQLRIGNNALINVVEFNNKLYAATTIGNTFVIENEIIVNSFQTLSNRPISSIGFDKLGQFAFTNYYGNTYVYD